MKLITTDIINKLMSSAEANPRLRMNYNIHESPNDPLQRIFIASKYDSYFRPHKHNDKSEFAIVLKGLFNILTFNDEGQVLTCDSIGPNAQSFAFDMPQNIWHTWVAMEDNCVFFEVKKGPYIPASAVEFAPWSPEEGSPLIPVFLNRLRDAKLGDVLR